MSPKGGPPGVRAVQQARNAASARGVRGEVFWPGRSSPLMPGRPSQLMHYALPCCPTPNIRVTFPRPESSACVLRPPECHLLFMCVVNSQQRNADLTQPTRARPTVRGASAKGACRTQVHDRLRLGAERSGLIPVGTSVASPASRSPQQLWLRTAPNGALVPQAHHLIAWGEGHFNLAPRPWRNDL